MFNESQSVLEYLVQQSKQQRADDEKRRQHRLLRLHAMFMVEAFANVLSDQAAEMGFAQGDNSALNFDRNAEALLWVFTEFLSQSLMDKTSRDIAIKAHQLTEAHAVDWFDLIPFDGWYVFKEDAGLLD